MKKLLFTIIILGACFVGSSQNWDSVRVGNLDVDSIMLGGAKIWEKPITPVFDEVIIGTQTWMAVNLDVDDGLGGIYAYGNNEANVATYGRLYTWDAAMRVAASIDGWHLPSDAEYKILEMYLGMSEEESNNIGERGSNEGSKLSGCDNLWTSGTMKENASFGDSGFNLIPAGVMIVSFNFFQDIGISGFLMTSTKDSESPFLPYSRFVTYNKATVDRNSYYPANPALSVRLIKD